MSGFQEHITASDPESTSDDEYADHLSNCGDDSLSTTEDTEPVERPTLPAEQRITPDLERTQQVNIFYSSLLEDFCTNKAIRTLNSQTPSDHPIGPDDARVKALAKANYAVLTKQLGLHGVIGQGYDGDHWQRHRQTYRDALEVMLDHALQDGSVPESSRTTSTALSPLAAPFISNGLPPPGSRPVSPKLLAGIGIEHETISSIQERLDNLQLHARTRPITGSDPTASLSISSTSEHPVFQPSRYRTDFAELGFLGKGGYGKVFRVINHLDGQQYAIKKITISPKRLRRIQDFESNEIEVLLREIRALARLEHLNVVRYYGGWVEQSTGTVRDDPPRLTSPVRATPSGRLAEDNKSFSLGMQFDDVQDQAPTAPNDGGILFEYSSDSLGDGMTDGNRGRRHVSELTTSSSMKTKSFVQSAGNDEDDVETISRPFAIPSHGHTSSTSSSGPSAPPDAGHPHPPPDRRNDTNETTWILHIQMSLYPLSLSSYLSPDNDIINRSDESIRRHCFHLLPSLRIILAILSGVVYLHSQGMVHRDLKPGNIFLSVHHGTPHSAGCVDISSCKHCAFTERDALFVVPRIGDFGLVANLSSSQAQSNNSSSVVLLNELAEPLPCSYKPATIPYTGRAVGTEFYRPPTGSVSINEKLDVFALGVIAFELLWKFETSKPRSRAGIYRN